MSRESGLSVNFPQCYDMLGTFNRAIRAKEGQGGRNNKRLFQCFCFYFVSRLVFFFSAVKIKNL